MTCHSLSCKCSHWYHWRSVLGSHGNMSEGSSRSSQEGLDGLHSDGRQQTTIPRPHLPVARVCAGPPAGAGRLRLQANTSPSANANSQSGRATQQQASGHTVSPTARLPRGGKVCDGESPPPYNAHHRLASSLSSPQVATPQRPPPRQNNSTTETQMLPHSPEWQDWQRDRWQIWQLISSDNADTPETLVWARLTKGTVRRWHPSDSHSLTSILSPFQWPPIHP